MHKTLVFLKLDFYTQSDSEGRIRNPIQTTFWRDVDRLHGPAEVRVGMLGSRTRPIGTLPAMCSRSFGVIGLARRLREIRLRDCLGSYSILRLGLHSLERKSNRPSKLRLAAFRFGDDPDGRMSICSTGRLTRSKWAWLIAQRPGVRLGWCACW